MNSNNEGWNASSSADLNDSNNKSNEIECTEVVDNINNKNKADTKNNDNINSNKKKNNNGNLVLNWKSEQLTNLEEVLSRSSSDDNSTEEEDHGSSDSNNNNNSNEWYSSPTSRNGELNFVADSPYFITSVERETNYAEIVKDCLNDIIVNEMPTFSKVGIQMVQATRRMSCKFKFTDQLSNFDDDDEEFVVMKRRALGKGLSRLFEQFGEVSTIYIQFSKQNNETMKE